MKTNDELLNIAKESGLTIKEISKLIETPYGTVKNWTRGKDSPSYRDMPRHALIAVRYCIESKLAEE